MIFGDGVFSFKVPPSNWHFLSGYLNCKLKIVRPSECKLGISTSMEHTFEEEDREPYQPHCQTTLDATSAFIVRKFRENSLAS